MSHNNHYYYSCIIISLLFQCFVIHVHLLPISIVLEKCNATPSAPFYIMNKQQNLNKISIHFTDLSITLTCLLYVVTYQIDRVNYSNLNFKHCNRIRIARWVLLLCELWLCLFLAICMYRLTQTFITCPNKCYFLVCLQTELI